MGAISVVQKSITAVLVIIAVTLVVGQLLGQPLLVGYVATGSMEPTIAVGDGFIAIPPVLAGGVSPGDVITFEAQSLDGGGPTTHRVIEETPEGYITQGDANSFTDQAAGEPPVNDAQVYAVALQIGGDVVVLPSLGGAATAVQNGVSTVTESVGAGSGGQIGIVTSGFGIVLITLTLIYGFLTSDHSRQTKRSTRRSSVVSGRVIVAGLVLLLMLPVMTSMMLPSETETINMLSVNPSVDDGSSRIIAGETTALPSTVENNQYVPKVVLVETKSHGIGVSNSSIAISHGESSSVGLTVTAPDETGPFSRSYSQHHYLYVLPIPIITLLHAIHPFVAMVTISLLSTTPIVLLYGFLVGIRPISIRSTQR
jgi:signal peptidase